jgi:hypothetical protein
MHAQNICEAVLGKIDAVRNHDFVFRAPRATLSVRRCARRTEGALQRRRRGACQPHVSAAALAPSAGHRPEDFRLGLDQHRLLLGSELDHAPVGVGVTEGGEDALADPKIGVPLMRALDRSGQAQCDLAKLSRRHGALAFAGLTSFAAVRSAAALAIAAGRTPHCLWSGGRALRLRPGSGTGDRS